MTNDPKEIAIAEYNYPLPEDRIAKYPLSRRDESKLLVYRHGNISETTFRHLPELLGTGTLLIFNDTKVIHARLLFQKTTGATVEVFCLEPYQTTALQAFSERRQCRWVCFIGNNKKWKDGVLELRFEIGGQETVLRAHRETAKGDAWVVMFEWNGGCSFAEVIERAGVIPLPPYLHREADRSDNERYQTVYATHDGSVAAPTAGLHFTEAVFSQLEAKGIDTEYITLDVGAGTFKPVSAPTIGEHEMHIENVHLTRSNLEHILSHASGQIIPVGTTTVRTLESVYWFGVRLAKEPYLDEMLVRQWDPYELEREALTTEVAYNNVLNWMKKKDTEFLDGATQLLIVPGYRYRVTHKLITNFHQPQSTLLLLVSALIGDDWKRCYQYALDHQFRFLSYGDSCLFEP